MGRYAARRDGNHAEIEAVFRRLLADQVTDTSAAGDGLGDLYVTWMMYGVFVEIKKDAKAEYTAHQIRFRNRHPYAVIRCESVDQAIVQAKMVRRLGELLAKVDEGFIAA